MKIKNNQNKKKQNKCIQNYVYDGKLYSQNLYSTLNQHTTDSVLIHILLSSPKLFGYTKDYDIVTSSVNLCLKSI